MKGQSKSYAQIKTILLLLTIILAAVFSIQNAAGVEMKFLFYSADVPLALLVLICILAGMVISYTVGLTNLFKQSKTRREQEKQIEEHESQIEELREQIAQLKKVRKPAEES